MISLDADERRKIIASARLLESDKPGERQAALEAVLRLLPDDLTIADALEKALPVVVEFDRRLFRPAHSIRPEPVALRKQWQMTAGFVRAFPQFLNEREREFLDEMTRRRDAPTDRQWSWLRSLEARVQERRAA